MSYSIDYISQILFIDIETAREQKNYDDLSEGMQKMWELKASKIQPESLLTPSEKYIENAAVYAEFARVICISVGFIYWRNTIPNLRIKSFFSKNEHDILKEFKDFLEQKTSILKFSEKNGNSPKKFHYLAAHNGREFDFPFLGRRFLVNQIPLPEMLEVRGKKPWEIKHYIDTMDMWKFGDSKNFTKLELLCHVLAIPTPKDDIDGSQVGSVFWDQEDLERIAIYCEKDVVATAQLYLRYSFMPIIAPENIEYTERVRCKSSEII